MSQGERNRLIIANMDLAANVAAEYRGQKSIPFEDLVAEARKWLVIAAGSPHRTGEFPPYASVCIRNGLQKFIREWAGLIGADDDDDWERYFYEWKVWGFAAPCERWESLAATPEQLLEGFEELNFHRDTLLAGFISLDTRSRSMMSKRFFRDPPMTFQDIARHHKLSYSRTVEIIDRSLKKLTEVVANIEKRRHEPLAM